MIFRLKTWNKAYSIFGSYRACLKLRLETDDEELCDRVEQAVRVAMAEAPKSKLEVMGFQREE